MANTKLSKTVEREARRKQIEKELAFQEQHDRLNKNLSLVAGIYVLLMFIVHPLILTNKYYNLIETKSTFFYICIFGALAALLFFFILEIIKGYKPGYKFKAFIKAVRPYEWAIFAYWVVMLISTILSPYPEETAWKGSSNRSESFLMQSCYIASFLMISRLYRFKERDLLIFCIVAAISSAYGICQYYGFDFLGLNPTNEELAGMGREVYSDTMIGPHLFLFSAMSNANTYSTYLVLALCISAIMLIRKSGKWQIYLPCTFIIFYMLLLANTDSGYVGIILSFAICFAFIVKDKKCAGRFFGLLATCFVLMWVHGSTYTYIAENFPEYQWWSPNVKPLMPFLPVMACAAAVLCAFFLFAKLPKISSKAWRRAWIILLVAVIVIAVIFIPFVTEKSGNPSIFQAAEILKGNVDDSFLSGRAGIWRMSRELIENRPLIGYGPDGFGMVFRENFDDVTIAQFETYFDKAHSEYVQALVDTGISGLCALLALYALALWGARKQLHHSAVIALFTAVLAFLIQAMFNFSTPIAHPIVWAAWGVMVAAYRHMPAADSNTG